MDLLFAIAVGLHLVITIIHLASAVHADATTEFAVCIALVTLAVTGIESVCHVASLNWHWIPADSLRLRRPAAHFEEAGIRVCRTRPQAFVIADLIRNP
jgi:hypothetical protein